MKVIVHLPTIDNQYVNLYIASKVLTGLCGLERQGECDLTFKTSLGHEKLGALLVLDVRDAARCRKVVIELFDAGNYFNAALLQSCDVYFKRSYLQSALAELPAPLSQKVLPLGLNFPCRGYGVTQKLMLPLLRQSITAMLRSGPQLFSSLRKQPRDMYNFLMGAPHIRAFEAGAAHATEPVILYQTRVWEDNEMPPEDMEHLNHQRVGVVRALRKAFGKQFVGGLVPTPRACREYSQYVTDQPTRKIQYLKMSRRAMIGVYTHGLYGSTGYAFSEHLAGSKAIVAEGIRYGLPSPLQEGTHFLGFTEPDECVEQCARLLSDRGLTSALRRNAFEYYRRDVEPRSHLRKLLHTCLAAGERKHPCTSATSTD